MSDNLNLRYFFDGTLSDFDHSKFLLQLVEWPCIPTNFHARFNYVTKVCYKLHLAVSYCGWCLVKLTGKPRA